MLLYLREGDDVFTDENGIERHVNGVEFNIARSCVEEDQYELDVLSPPDGSWLIDVGAHVGGVSVSAAVTYPLLNVLALEALQENADLLQANAALNGVSDRMHVLVGALGTDEVVYGYESAVEHNFIANHGPSISWKGALATRFVPRYTIENLIWLLDADVCMVKIDCEGGEWDGFVGAERVPLIVGEWHPWHGAEGRTREDFAALLPSHDVTFDPLGLVEGPGGFTARLRLAE